MATAREVDGRPARTEHHRVVIIGSGVGGSVTAFRLAEAGVDSLVLERGRRWSPSWGGSGVGLLWGRTARPSPGPFTSVTAVSARLALAGAVLAAGKGTGPLEMWMHPQLAVVCGAAVGGSTVLYGGVLAQPPRDLFTRVFPAELDYAELDAVHYPRARQRMISHAFPGSRLRQRGYRDALMWREALTAAGLRVEPIVGNYDAEMVDAELTGRATPAVTIGNYTVVGCASGAKMSVDRTYLARAEATGRTEVRPLHLVTGLSEDASGRYRVSVDRLDPGGAVVERLTVHCDHLVVAAGALHTPQLLVTARDTGGLPRLNEHVGRRWGTNGDQARVVVTAAVRPGLPQAGPPSCFGWDHDGALAVLHGPFAAPSGVLLVLGMGIPDDFGQWRYRPATGTAHLVWDHRFDATPRRLFDETVRKIAARLPVNVTTDPLGVHSAHPLGGAVLGDATDAHGRLHGHRRLYCLDGALMPGCTAAVNPALTIAAVVERCMDHIVGDFADGA